MLFITVIPVITNKCFLKNSGVLCIFHLVKGNIFLTKKKYKMQFPFKISEL